MISTRMLRMRMLRVLLSRKWRVWHSMVSSFREQIHPPHHYTPAKHRHNRKSIESRFLRPGKFEYFWSTVRYRNERERDFQESPFLLVEKHQSSIECQMKMHTAVTISLYVLAIPLLTLNICKLHISFHDHTSRGSVVIKLLCKNRGMKCTFRSALMTLGFKDDLCCDFVP